MHHVPRILVIEDEPVLARNTAQYLRRRFAEVHVASHPSMALGMTAWYSPQLAVMDYRLPGMTGVELYAAMLRTCRHPIECVMTTGYPLERVRSAAGREGIRRVLVKPYPLDALAAAILASMEARCA